MVPSSPAPPASTSIVRFWRDRSGDELRWRGHIRHVQGGKSASCLHLEGILDFIQHPDVMTEHTGECAEEDTWFASAAC
jgi:hypothetical protein